MTLPRVPLLVRIIIAIALGLAAGLICPDWLARCFATFNAIFSSYLGFIIPLLILAFVAPAIADIGRGAGRMLVVTAALAYGFTLLAGFITYFTADALFPSMIQPVAYVAAEAAAPSSQPYFTMEIQPLMGVLTALVLAFALGMGVARLGTPAMRAWLADLRDIVAWLINCSVIPLLPLYIFGIFLDMSATGAAAGVLLTFASIIAVIFALHIGMLLLQYCISGLIARRNPLRSLWTMMPAYFTALGTQSSAATIPVTLRRAVAMGVSQDVAAFTIPLCATIHMSGSTLKIVGCAMALMLSQGLHYDLGMMAGFIAMLGITIIAAPGVPGGAIMASLGLLSTMLGFSQADCALMIALYIAMDSFGTACNVTGDGAIAQIVDRFFRPAAPATQAANS